MLIGNESRRRVVVDDGSLMLVHFVEQQLEGWTFERDHWPLHITLVPWFVVQDEEAVNRGLERVAGDTDTLRLGVGEQDMFGVNRDVPVNVINNQADVMALHEKLIEAIGRADMAFHKQQFPGQRYVAHITRHHIDGRHSNEHEEILMHDFQLVRLIDATTCRVERQFDLRHSK